MRNCDPAGFPWIAADDAAKSIYTYCRTATNGQQVVVVVNFTPSTHFDYRIGVPDAGWYVEILNSDSEVYGGSNVGNLGFRTADELPSHGRPYSLELNIPPLAIMMLTLCNAPGEGVSGTEVQKTSSDETEATPDTAPPAVA